MARHGYTNREKSRCLMTGGEGHKDFLKAFFRYSNSGFTNLIFKSEEHYKKCKKHFDTNYLEKTAKEVDKIRDHVEGNEVYDGIRYLTSKERERLQGLPEGYTKSLSDKKARDVIGDGWQIDTVCYLLQELKKEF